MKIIRDRWNENQEKLEKVFENKSREELENLRYKDLVTIAFDTIYNDRKESHFTNVDTSKITQIDDGEYQGTLLFLLPFDTYQPHEGEYLMTYVGYGSCSYCDTLWGIQALEDKEDMIRDYMCLCKDILAHAIKPYNDGWRNATAFDEATY
jgi:hypothetical protein